MAKRSIAYTVMEGGRSKHYRNEEREKTRSERRSNRIQMHRATIDPEIADEEPHAVRSTPWGKDFADKLAPMRRWLESQVGRPWVKVHSEIVNRFDSNTLAGRHALGHMKEMVRDRPDDNPYTWYRTYGGRNLVRRPGELYVNRAGVLCKEPEASHAKYIEKLRKARG